MSTNDEDFLTPRGLLVQGSFVCDGPSFKEFQAAVDASLNLPYDQQGFMRWCGISLMGWSILVTQLNPIVDTCYTAVQAIQLLGYAYREVGTVCDRILDTSSTAEHDYDAMFQGLNDLTDDPDNGDLRQKVQKLTADRLDGVTALESKTDATFGQLNEGTDGVKNCEDQLKTILKNLNGSELEDELRERDPADDLEDDLTALGVIREKVAAMNMEDQSGEAIHNMQLVLGSVRVIITDLTAIEDSIEKANAPANEIILGHEKAKIIRKWNDLAVEGELDLLKQQLRTAAGRPSLLVILPRVHGLLQCLLVLLQRLQQLVLRFELIRLRQSRHHEGVGAGGPRHDLIFDLLVQEPVDVQDRLHLLHGLLGGLESSTLDQRLQQPAHERRVLGVGSGFGGSGNGRQSGALVSIGVE
ncbi:uncharacterized protein KD926_010302 [Aspergillus affinis]|uniref:uncharacterized protein n=1 Tax=Aspergillus affinis TaxID=1070780 RepID=UPI0022FE1068|nr:uncharacterized protein KD926_010302 [Aspergillus affinis]KAI9044979.1 hypothetical protein KD926_010302 [Aspergillus affinis]